MLFITSLSEQAAENAVIPRMLSKCCERYPTMAELNRRLSELYSASVTWSCSAFGDEQILELDAAALGSRFALDNEDIVGETAKILRDCIFAPYFEDGLFPAGSLDIEKKNQIDFNNAEINDKSFYAFFKAYQEAVKGEPARLRATGTNEDTEAITPESALAAYRRMTAAAPVEIICIGESDFDGVEKIFTDAFRSLERKAAKRTFSRKSPPKSELSRVNEKLDIEQSKLVMIFKTPVKNRFALNVMSGLYGGTELSKLFTIVREKMSLCYYCYSMGDRIKGMLTVRCGVDAKNLDKAEKECLSQLEEIKKGNFTDDDIEKVKLDTINTLRSSYDTINGTLARSLAWILCEEEPMTTDEYVERISAVSREDIIEAADSLVLDTVYTLGPQE